MYSVRLYPWSHVLAAIAVWSLWYLPVGAQWTNAPYNTAVAQPIFVQDTVQDGDIVTYDAPNGMYRRANVSADAAMVGVIVTDPLLSVGKIATGTQRVPFVNMGDAYVNVSTIGGAIRAGDLITTSRIPGFGQKANSTEVTYILGFALENMQIDPSAASASVDGSSVDFGRVPVAIRIGLHVPDGFDRLVASTTMALQAVSAFKDLPEKTHAVDYFKAFRYILGAFVAVAALVIALRRFGEMFSQSVVSVGRNPLARTQIRSVLTWNAILILIVSGVGFAIGALLILIP